jgi:FkbM family methyltransferase
MLAERDPRMGENTTIYDRRLHTSYFIFVSLFAPVAHSKPAVLFGGGGQLFSEIGTIADGRIVISKSRAGAGVFGPFIDLPYGRYQASIHFAADHEASGTVVMDVCTDFGHRILRSERFDLASLPKRQRRIRFAFLADTVAMNCEVRLHCSAGTSAAITGIEIAAPGSARLLEAQLLAALHRLSTRLERLERISRGGQATYVGKNRVLAKAVIRDTTLGFLVQADDRVIVPYLILHGEYEPPLTHWFLENVPPTAHCLDVGANYGYYTCLLACLARLGRTLGIEPDEEVFELLRDNVYINSLHAVAAVRRAAVSDTAGQLTLFRRLTRSANTSIINLPPESVSYLGEPPPEPFQVESVPVDSLLGYFDGRIDIAKIDVEGAEPLVFRGAHKTLAANPQIKIVMEWSPLQIRAAGFDPAEFLTELETLRLEVAMIDTSRPRPVALRDLLQVDYHPGVLLTVRT